MSDTNKLTELAQSLSPEQAKIQGEQLARGMNFLFSSYGSEERLRNPENAARLYSNLFNMMMGCMAAKIGVDETLRILESVVKIENESWKDAPLAFFSAANQA